MEHPIGRLCRPVVGGSELQADVCRFTGAAPVLLRSAGFDPPQLRRLRWVAPGLLDAGTARGSTPQLHRFEELAQGDLTHRTRGWVAQALAGGSMWAGGRDRPAQGPLRVAAVPSLWPWRLELGGECFAQSDPDRGILAQSATRSVKAPARPASGGVAWPADLVVFLEVWAAA